MRRPRAAYQSGQEHVNLISPPSPTAPLAPLGRSRWGLGRPSISPGGSAYRTGRSGSGVSLVNDNAEVNERGKGWMVVVLKVVFHLTFWPLILSILVAATLYRFLLRVGCSRSPLSFRDPSRWLVRAVSKPFRLVNPSVVLGAENLRGCFEGGGERSRAAPGAGLGRDRRPVLLVGNQNLLGLDCVPILEEMQGRTGVLPRVLYDTLFGFVLGWRQLAEALGGVKGTMGNCEALMSEGKLLMLYPGGAREAFKCSKEDKHKLKWHDKLGFVRMAVKHNYNVIPFASVGIEDAVSVAFGVDVSWLVRQAEPDRGPLRFPVLYPYNSFQRQYFGFGKPIETAQHGSDWENLDKCTAVYDSIKEEVERLILQLQKVQEEDPDRFLLRRVCRGFRRMFRPITGDDSAEEVPAQFLT